MKPLGRYISIKHGYAFRGDHITAVDNGIVLVTPGNFCIGGGFKEEKCKFFNGKVPKDYVLKENDLIVTMTDLSKEGDTLGYCAKVPKSERIYLHNQRIGLIQFSSEDVEKDYLYWFLRTKKYHDLIVSTSSGSTVKHTSPSRICEVEIDLPSMGIQKKVVSILNSIDEKIRTNERINKNLAA